MQLFNEPTTNNNTCKTCVNRQPWQCNSKVIQYCTVIKSNRTENGLKKIKCKTPACSLYKSVDEDNNTYCTTFGYEMNGELKFLKTIVVSDQTNNK